VVACVFRFAVSLCVFSLLVVFLFSCCFFSIDPATIQIYTLSLHDALPISIKNHTAISDACPAYTNQNLSNQNTQYSSTLTLEARSEEHTSELQSRFDLVCRLLLEKKNKIKITGDIDMICSSIVNNLNS